MQRKYTVICPHCKKGVLESECDIDTTMRPNGTMFHAIEGLRVRQPHKRWTHIKGQNFPCPVCMNPLTGLHGHLTLKCQVTGEVFRTGNEPPVLPDEAPVEAESRDECIIRLRSEGLSYAKISEKVGCSQYIVRKVLKKG